MIRLPLCLLCLGAVSAAELAVLTVDNHAGVHRTDEPVSWDVTLPAGVAADRLGLRDATGAPRTIQVEPLADGRQRVWTAVTTAAVEQQRFTLVDTPAPAATPGVREVARAEGGVVYDTGVVRVRITLPRALAEPTAGDALPGPVQAIGRADGALIGASRLQVRQRVLGIDDAGTLAGPLFVEQRLRWRFADGSEWRTAVRLWAGKPYALISEDCAQGGDARWLFSYGDWPATHFWRTRDGGVDQPWTIADARNPCGDFITEEGQTCLARLVVWSQFGYFGGKQETVGLIRDGLFVGGIYHRPDRWTRAKVNHVDLWLRPEVPGQPATRGVVGLADAVPRPALEAWLIDGHREWALTCAPAGRWEEEKDKDGRPVLDAAGKPKPVFAHDRWLWNAHLTVGVWPLDRLNRLTLVWNADGSPVPPDQRAPQGDLGPWGGDIGQCLGGTGFRHGLAVFNGSNQNMRRAIPSTANGYLKAMKARSALMMAGTAKRGAEMAGPALWAYLAMDEATYPGRRAMLPWSDPEALNPFYQGMENQNFNAERYYAVALVGAGLRAAGHPDGERFLRHGEEQLDLALGRYFYPGSGCYEESHGYCAHTMHAMSRLALLLRDEGIRDFHADERFARMFAFWCVAHSPRDTVFDGKRIPPPIGDHGLMVDGFVEQFRAIAPELARADAPYSRQVARWMAWLVREKKAEPIAGIEPEEPPLASRYLQGYGAALRDRRPAGGPESYLVLRACQSWGHHHQDKGSLWFWGRNVPFFGDAAWGQPPGGTYGNAYKQGPAGGTQIEFVGINNWPLPCKYPGAFIADDAYADDVDYAVARCPFPYNPPLDLTASGPVAGENQLDRQILWLKPDLLVVRDNVRALVPTVWRLHSYHVDGTTLAGVGATIVSPHGVAGDLRIVHPAGAVLTRIDGDDLNLVDGAPTHEAFGFAKGQPRKDKGGKPEVRKDGTPVVAPHDTRSCVLRWEMPTNRSATWCFAVRGADQQAVAAEALDDQGRVLRLRHASGLEAIVFLDRVPFTWSGEGLRFAGTAGAAWRTNGGAWTRRAIRGTLE